MVKKFLLKSKKSIKLIGIGPASSITVTGQSLHFERACSQLLKCDGVIYYSRYRNLFVDSLVFMFNLARLRLKDKSYHLYYTPSRTTQGLIRDFLIVLSIFNNSQIRIVAHIHGSEFAEFYLGQTRIFKALTRWVYSQHSSTIVLSNGIREDILQFVDTHVEVIPNNIPVDNKDLNSIKIYSNDCINILWCSNLLHSKGIEVFLDSLSILPDTMKSFISVDIIGKFVGDEYKDANQIETDCKFKLDRLIENGWKVNFRGPMPNKEAIKYFRSADIFALPTFYRTEAMPISVLEAFLYKCRVILSDWKYLSDIFSDYKVAYVNPTDTLSLSDTLLEEIDHVKTGGSQHIERLNHNFRVVKQNSFKSDIQLVNHIKDITN